MKSFIRVISIALILLLSGYVIFSIYTKNHPPAATSAPSGEKDSKQGADGIETKPEKSARAGLKHLQESNDPIALDLAEARRRLAHFRSENKDVIDHAEFAAELVAELCRSGHTQDAWEFIEQSSGQMRNMQLREFFKNADLDRTELLASLSGLKYDLDLKRGLEGYFLRIKPSEYVNELATPEIMAMHQSLGISSSEALRKAMDSLTGDLYHRKHSDRHPPSEATVKELLDSFARMDAEGLIKVDDLQEMVLGTPLDTFIKWDLLKRHAGAPEGLGEGAKRRLIGNMIVQDPQKAMSEILATPGAGQSGNVDLAIHEWLGADSGGLMNWYTKNLPGFGSKKQSLVASGFAKSALLGSDFDNARIWAGQIQDPASKDRVFKAIADKEAKAASKN